MIDITIKKTGRLLNCICVILLVSISSFSQNSPKEHEYYKLFDSIIGVGNNGLYNGTPYEERFRTLNISHKYFVSSEFVKGNIVFNKQPYYNIQMKYDIYEDELIVKLPTNSGFAVIQLSKENIEKFSISGHQFIKLSQVNNSTFQSNTGFYEVLHQSNLIQLFKKYNKERSEHTDEKVIYSKFKGRTYFLVAYDDKYVNIRAKRDMINLFPKQKKKINAFYHKRKSLRKSNYDSFLSQLMIEIGDFKQNKLIES